MKSYKIVWCVFYTWLFVMITGVCFFSMLLHERVKSSNVNKPVIKATTQDYTAQQYCDAIYIIEGKEKARQPFGIESIECRTFNRCEVICLNTIRNNRVRYEQYGHEQYETYDEFLASRYCPPNQKVWLKNLMFYLRKN